MAEERPGAWFGFGFCGFGQALGCGRGRQVHSPEPLRAGADVCCVSAAWSYTAVVTRGGRVELSGSVSGAAGGCRAAWATEGLVAVLLRAGRDPKPELAGPGAPRVGRCAGEPPLGPGRCRRKPRRKKMGTRGEGPGWNRFPLVAPGPAAYTFWPPEACGRPRAWKLGRGATAFTCWAPKAQVVLPWGGGRSSPCAHQILTLYPWPWALPWEGQGSSEAGDIYVWGWNESGQLALPARSLAEDRKAVMGKATSPQEDGCEAGRAAAGEDGAPAAFIAVQPFPALLDLPLGAEAVKASCGSRHTAVVTRTGELYTWGWGKYGQLGHTDAASVDRPCRVEYFVNEQLQVKAVTCGPWNTYVYAEARGTS
uniref:RCC1 domain containing 1 n=1 Tax=Oryctolagus cuniculus TaxID=9986 RepID=G1TQ70_RABIT